VTVSDLVLISPRISAFSQTRPNNRRRVDVAFDFRQMSSSFLELIALIRHRRENVFAAVVCHRIGFGLLIDYVWFCGCLYDSQDDYLSASAANPRFSRLGG